MAGAQCRCRDDTECPSAPSSSTPTARCSTCTPRSPAIALRPGPEADRFSEIWRTKQLEYAWMLSAAGHYVDFWTLTERALDHALRARSRRSTKSLRAALLDAYFKLDAFPGRPRRARGAEGERREDRDPVERQSRRMLDGAVGAAGIGDRCSTRCSRSTRSASTSRAGGLRAGDRRVQRRAGRRRVRLVEPLGRDGRDCVRLPLRVGQPRRHAGRVSRSSRRSRSCATWQASRRWSSRRAHNVALSSNTGNVPAIA